MSRALVPQERVTGEPVNARLRARNPTVTGRLYCDTRIGQDAVARDVVVVVVDGAAVGCINVRPAIDMEIDSITL